MVIPGFQSALAARSGEKRFEVSENGGQESRAETTIKKQAGEDEDLTLICGKMDGEQELYPRRSQEAE